MGSIFGLQSETGEYDGENLGRLAKIQRARLSEF